MRRLLWVLCVWVVWLLPASVLARTVRVACLNRGAGEVTVLYPRGEAIPNNARFLVDRWSHCAKIGERGRPFEEYRQGVVLELLPAPYGQARLVDAQGRVIPTRMVRASLVVLQYDVNASYIKRPRVPDERAVWLVPEGPLPAGRVVLEQRAPVVVGPLIRGEWTTRGVAWRPVRAFTVAPSPDHTPPTPPALREVAGVCAPSFVYGGSWSELGISWGRALVSTPAKDRRAGRDLLYVLERRRVRSGGRVVSEPWVPVSAFTYRGGVATYAHPAGGYGWDGAWEQPHELHMWRGATLHIHRAQDTLMDRWVYRLHALDLAGNLATSREVETSDVLCDTRARARFSGLVERVEAWERGGVRRCGKGTWCAVLDAVYTQISRRWLTQNRFAARDLWRDGWVAQREAALSRWCDGSAVCTLAAEVVDELLLSSMEPERLARLIVRFSPVGGAVEGGG